MTAAATSEDMLGDLLPPLFLKPAPERRSPQSDTVAVDAALNVLRHLAAPLTDSQLHGCQPARGVVVPFVFSLLAGHRSVLPVFLRSTMSRNALAVERRRHARGHDGRGAEGGDCPEGFVPSPMLLGVVVLR